MEGRTPILIDFGLARVADDPKLTHTGWLLGTPGYLAPEILYGEDATAGLRRALLGRDGRVRRHRPPAVRPRPVDGDHGPGPARRARPHRAARRPAPRSSPRRSTPSRAPADARPAARLAAAARRPDAGASAEPAPADRGRARPLHGAARAGRAGRAPTSATDQAGSGAATRWRCTPRGAHRLSSARTEPRADGAAGRSRERLRRGALLVAPRGWRPAPARRGVPLAGARLLLAAHLAAAQRLAGRVRARPAPRTLRGPQVVRRRAAARRRALAPGAVDPRRGAARCCGASGSRPRARPGLLRARRRASSWRCSSCGLVLAGSLWSGPGGSRVRGPVSRVVNPLAAGPAARGWSRCVVVVAGARPACSASAADWSPARRWSARAERPVRMPRSCLADDAGPPWHDGGTWHLTAPRVIIIR